MNMRFLFVVVLFCLASVIGCSEEIHERISIEKSVESTQAEAESSGSRLIPRESWQVFYYKEVKKGNSVSVSQEQFSPKDLNIDDPENISQEELWNKFRVFQRKKEEEASQVRCVIQECHGLDISCGFQKGEGHMCTMEYWMGDFCRSFAVCEVVEGECRLAENQKFKQCKACMDECGYGISCEDKCREEFR